MKTLGTSLLVLALMPVLGTVQKVSAQGRMVSPDPKVSAPERLVFPGKGLEAIAKLPLEERKVIISWLYRDVLFAAWEADGKLFGFGGGGMGFMHLGLEHNSFGAPVLIALFGKHKEIIAPLLKADLQSRKKNLVVRALNVIGDARLKEYYDAVADIFKNDAALADDAAHTLTYLGGPRVIRLLIEKDPKDPLHYEDHLRSLSKSRPADPLLIKLLRSKDAATRAKACHILIESGDDALVPEVIRLVKDDDPDVRWFAAAMAFRFSKEGFARVRSSLITLLTDKSVQVRLSVAQSFASNGDKVCARTLLELLQDKSIRRGAAGVYWTDGHWLWHSVRSLSGIDAPDYNGSAAEQAAIRKFAEWVKKNAPEK